MEYDYPLSFFQQMLWILQQSQPENPFYNQCLGYRIKGALKASLLEKALGMMVAKNSALRASFISRDSMPLQQIHPHPDLNLRIVDLKNEASTEKNAILQDKIQQEAILPFDLEKAPLFRAVLYIMADEEFFLQFTIHHLICDGIAMVNFFKELSTFYNSLIHETVTPVEPVKPDYFDFVLWQQEWAKSAEYEKQLEYWKNTLSGIPRINLPADYGRPPINTFAGKTYSFLLSETIVARLKQMAQKNGVTLYTLLITLYWILLYRYCGQPDFGIGIPVANRLKRDFRNTIGLFTNTIVIRCGLDGDPTFAEQLQRIWEKNKESYTYQAFPLHKLISAMQTERHSNYNPLYQVLFDLEEFHRPKPEFHDMEIETVKIENNTAKLDLSLIITISGEKLQCSFEYNTGLFLPRTIARLEASFTAIIESVLENPHQKISKLPLLTKTEYRKICDDWNQTQETYPLKCVHELIEEQVALSKNKVAICFGDQEITYENFNNRANALARIINRKNPSKNGVIGVCLERSPEMLIALIAVLKSGHTYIPIDPHYPEERILFMLEDAGADLIITETIHRDKFGSRLEQCLVIDEKDMIAGEDTSNLELNISPETLAYIIYTSGSTGKPKGVRICHRSLANFLHATRKKPGMYGDDVMLALTTISFDIAVLEIYLPLTTGAKIVLVPQNETNMGESIIKAMEQHAVTMLQGTPTTYRILLASGWQIKPNLKILIGGEGVPSDLAKELLQKAGSVWAMYGPTETTVWSSVYQVGTNPEYNDLFYVPIGFPIANTQLYIVDANLQLVPIGVAGELLIGGAGLSPGYVKRSELTAEKFIHKEFSDDQKPDSAHTILYRTGDLAKRLPDGNIEFLGRIDQQIKIRGFRIEIGEIESVLAEHEDVAQAVVAAKSYHTVDQRLVAYIVPRTVAGANLIPDLKSYLSSKLPAYMIPGSFCILDKMPLTVTGKVDRKALPDEGFSSITTGSQYVEPQSALQKSIANIWKEVLGINCVGINDNFFDVGGDSFLIISAAKKINELTGEQITVVDLFAHPTLQSLAEFLSQRSQTPSANFDEMAEIIRKQKEARERRIKSRG